MTETNTGSTAEQQPSSAQIVEALGAAATTASHYEVTIQDLAELHSKHIYEEYTRAWDTEAPHHTVDQFGTVNFIHGFIQGKAAEISENKLPAGMVRSDIKSLRAERDHIVQTSARAPFMRSQKALAMPVLAAYADDYPEIHFATLLRNELQAHDNIKEAMQVSEILIATARTINRINQNRSIPESTDGI